MVSGPRIVTFIREGAKWSRTRIPGTVSGQLGGARDWNLLTDFVGRSVTKLLRKMGIRGLTHRRAVNALSRAAERVSQ